jgi:nucleoside diphosphate kinase
MRFTGVHLQMWTSVESAGLKLAKLKMVTIGIDDASFVFGPRARYACLVLPVAALSLTIVCVCYPCSAIASAPVVVMEFVGPDVTNAWNSVMGVFPVWGTAFLVT